MHNNQQWIEKFPGLSRLEATVKEKLLLDSQVVDMPEGAVIFGPGKKAQHLLLLLDGTIRVQQVSEQGREIVLYRVHAGESCVLTTACLLAYADYNAEGIAESAVQAAAIPRRTFDDLMADSGDFRQFVFSAYSHRVTELFQVIQEIAFQRMDIRLAHKLLELGKDKESIQATHHQMAAELGTAREVISRQLGEFQRRGWVELSRGNIMILDGPSLTRLAGTD